MERTFTSSQGLLALEVKNVPITVIGAGGIGSFLVLALVKMGFTNVTVYDADLIEDHNVDNQLYGHKHLGMMKVDALRELCEDLADITIYPKCEWYTGKEPIAHQGILIFAVDSITARNDIWVNLKASVNSMLDCKLDVTKFFIDARMGAEIIRIFTVNPMIFGEIEMYEESLHPQGESYVAPCTEKSIMYTPFVAGGEVASLVKQFLMGQSVPQEETYSFFDHSMKVRYLNAPKTETLSFGDPA
jgi:hypothetical protein